MPDKRETKVRILLGTLLVVDAEVAEAPGCGPG